MLEKCFAWIGMVSFGVALIGFLHWTNAHPPEVTAQPLIVPVLPEAETVIIPLTPAEIDASDLTFVPMLSPEDYVYIIRVADKNGDLVTMYVQGGISREGAACVLAFIEPSGDRIETHPGCQPSGAI